MIINYTIINYVQEHGNDLCHSCTIQFSMAAFQKLEVISALPPKVGLLRLREVVGGIHRAVGTFRQH